MKCGKQIDGAKWIESPLAIAEWIEMMNGDAWVGEHGPSPLAIAEWIEMFRTAGQKRTETVSASDSGVD